VLYFLTIPGSVHLIPKCGKSDVPQKRYIDVPSIIVNVNPSGNNCVRALMKLRVNLLR
jgi:hypothetical protein